MEYTQEELRLAAESKPSLWVIQNKILNEAGMPIDFKKRKFLIEMYNDLSPKQALLKPPQIGATVMSLLKTMWVAKKLGKDIIYTLPTATDVVDIVGGSLNRIIVQNQMLRTWVKEHDTVEQKSVGDNLIRYRGTFSPKQATMVPSSLNVHDEVDNSDPTVLTLYQTRLEAQEKEEDKWRWYFSHPSLQGHGVDMYWAESDKKEWYITCPHCKEEQYMSWPDNVNVDRETFICSVCKEDLPTESRINGVWKNQDGVVWTGKIVGDYDFSGWHVSQLMLHNKSARDIIKSFRDPQKDKQYFYNYVLGLPYIGSEDKIEPSVVLRNCVDIVNPQEGRVIIGVDSGHDYISYVLMNRDGVFYYDTERGITASKNPYDKLREYLKRFPKSVVVIDQGGELMNTRQLQAEFPGRVFLVYYNKDRKSVEMVEWGENDEYWKVRVDRNRMITLMVEQLRDIGRYRINGTREEWEEFASHFGNIYREKVEVKETKGKDDRSLYGNEYVWKRNGPDHYCFVAGTKITTDRGDIDIEHVWNGDLVLTRNGYKPVYDAGLRRSNQRVYTAYFSNGSSFTATGDHPVIHREGKTRLDELSPHAILYACNQNQSFTTESRTEDILTQKIEQPVSTTHRTERIVPRDTKGCISNYGLMLMARSLKVLSFIIKTKIRLITSFLTWCARINQNTKATTYSINSPTQKKRERTKNTSTESESYPMSGGLLKKVKHGTQNMLVRLSFWLFPKYLSALSVILKVLHEATREVSSVVPDVVIVGLHENIERKDVINLSVEDEHEYYANGILVSNCHALLYATVGLQRYGGEMAKIVGASPLDGIPKGLMVQPQGIESFIRGEAWNA